MISVPSLLAKDSAAARGVDSASETINPARSAVV